MAGGVTDPCADMRSPFPSRAIKKGLGRNESPFLHSPFYFAFIWFKVQGSGFRGEVAASPPFLEDGILVSQPSPLG